MFIVVGADWCPGCKAVRAALTKRNLEHLYVQMPPGEEGWDMVEKLTGRRAVPAVMFKFDGPKATTGFQGEVKGASPNQGKVCLGSLNLILKLHDLDQVPDVRPIINRGGAARQTLESNVKELMEKTSPGFTEKKYTEVIQNKVKKGELEGFLYAMGSNYYLYKIITGISNNDKRNQVCEDLLLYASSQSVISAPYYKLE